MGGTSGAATFYPSGFYWGSWNDQKKGTKGKQ
jgi:hypothetical protein